MPWAAEVWFSSLLKDLVLRVSLFSWGKVDPGPSPGVCLGLGFLVFHALMSQQVVPRAPTCWGLRGAHLGTELGWPHAGHMP